jgi:hypothetical protein
VIGQTTGTLPILSNLQSLPTANWNSVETSGLPRLDRRCVIFNSGTNMYLFGFQYGRRHRQTDSCAQRVGKCM